MAEKTHRFDPDYSCPPGEILLEMLEERNMTASELATRSGIPESQVLSLISGRARLTVPIADALATAFPVSAATWLRMEDHWRSFLAKDAARLRKTA